MTAIEIYIYNTIHDVVYSNTVYINVIQSFIQVGHELFSNLSSSHSQLLGQLTVKCLFHPHSPMVVVVAAPTTGRL